MKKNRIKVEGLKFDVSGVAATPLNERKVRQISCLKTRTSLHKGLSDVGVKKIKTNDRFSTLNSYLKLS